MISIENRRRRRIAFACAVAMLAGTATSLAAASHRSTVGRGPPDETILDPSRCCRSHTDIEHRADGGSGGPHGCGCVE